MLTSTSIPEIADQKSDSAAWKARAASALLKSVGHQTRLLILCILSEREKTVGELEELLGLQQAIVSQQLARLRNDGLVHTRRDGRQIYYSISKPGTQLFLKSLFGMLPSQDNA